MRFRNPSSSPINSHDNVMSRNIPQSESEYMLLFRGTDWHKGLSSETVRTVMNRWYDWFERLAEQGKATSGHPLAYEGKLVSEKRGTRSSMVPSSNPRKRSVATFSFRLKAKRRLSRSPRNARDLNTASRWKFDLSLNSALRARLLVRPSSNSTVERRHDKQLNRPNRPGL